jgi:hypothetical protein
MVLFILGLVHFGNLYALNQMRQRARSFPAAPRAQGRSPAEEPIGRILE